VEMNIFDYLLEQYNHTAVMEGGCAGLPGSEGPLGEDHFVAFCKAYLQGNPPVGTAVVGFGLAVRLRKGQVLTFTKPPAPERPEGKAITISSGEVDPAQQGISNTDSMQITDPNRAAADRPRWGPSR